MYFDPGTGSMIFQIVIAAIASVGALFVTFKDSILSFFRRRKNEDEVKK